jgi:hypothetical protein
MSNTRLDSAVGNDIEHDFLTRLYLRQYAFLTRRYPRQPQSTIYHLATLGVSGLVSLAGLAVLAFGFWFVSRVLGRPITPWAAPNWLIAAGSLGLTLLPGLFIDKKMSPLRFVEQGLIAMYSEPRERRRWWMAVLSIVPLAGIVAACFTALRATS